MQHQTSWFKRKFYPAIILATLFAVATILWVNKGRDPLSEFL